MKHVYAQLSLVNCN